MDSSRVLPWQARMIQRSITLAMSYLAKLKLKMENSRLKCAA
jgi:hypothetical protein